MKREDLEKLGLEKEVIDSVMDLHQADTEENKRVLATKDSEITTLTGKVTTLSDEIAKFDGTDIEALKQSVIDAEAKYNTDLSKIKFDSALEIAITKAGAKNPKALKGLLDLEKIKFENDALNGFDEQLTTIKESDAYLFGDVQPTTGKYQGGNPPKTDGVEEAFKQLNPELKID